LTDEARDLLVINKAHEDSVDKGSNKAQLEMRERIEFFQYQPLGSLTMPL
jgi:hypothetical protein